MLQQLWPGADWTQVRNVADRPGHDRRYSLNADRLHEMGFCPALSLADGLRETVAWYRENVAWWRPLAGA